MWSVGDGFRDLRRFSGNLENVPFLFIDKCAIVSQNCKFILPQIDGYYQILLTF